MTFYGESMRVSGGWTFAGAIAGSTYRYAVAGVDDGTTVTATVGDSFAIGCYGSKYLTETDTVGGLKWVVRASGTGTLDLADTHDDNWDATDPTTPFTSLPSLSIDSAGFTDYTFDASASMRDAALLGGYTMTGEMIELKITVTSGTVTFDKVRLQMEPVGGIVGHWSGWVADPNPIALTPWPLEWSIGFHVGDPDYLGRTVSTYTEMGFGPEAKIYWNVASDGSSSPSRVQGIVLYPDTTWEHPRLPQAPTDLSGGSLVDGVDYITNPYHTQDDDWGFNHGGSYYVEYQDVASTILGWDLGTLNYNAYSYAPGSMLQVEFNRNLPVHAIGETPDMPAMGSGVVVHQSGAAPMNETQYGIPVGYDPGPDTFNVGLFIHDSNLLEAPPFTAPWGYEFFGGAVWPRDTYPPGPVPGSWPAVRVTAPAYRYWIPAPGVTPPLRQVQRNDGLGRSTLRGRGASSVQRSIRQRGYR